MRNRRFVALFLITTVFCLPVLGQSGNDKALLERMRQLSW